MTEHKSFFRSIVDSMIESRSRQAAREVAYHTRTLRLDGEDKRVR